MCLFRYKTVAFSGNSSNILPAAAQAVELLADRSNRYLQVMAACYDRGFPNAVIELFIGKNFVRIAGEKSKKIKLQSGKIAFCTGICHNAAPGVNLQISKCDHLVRKDIFTSADPCQDPIFQFNNIIRFSKKIIASYAEAADPVFAFRKPGKKMRGVQLCSRILWQSSKPFISGMSISRIIQSTAADESISRDSFGLRQQNT